MSTNSRFAIAVHALVLLARGQDPISSSAIAESVNTNPVTIRKVLGSLSAAGLVSTQMGADGGAMLARAPQAISLLDVYRATEQSALFAHHPRQPNQGCPCGKSITPVLDDIFSNAESALCSTLAHKSLADVVGDVEREIEHH